MLARLRLDSMSDRALATVAGVALSVLAAWPMLEVENLPLQDLPNHLATSWALLHVDRYPELSPQGFFRTNSVLVAWLTSAGRVMGLPLAAKVFAIASVAAMAIALMRFVLAFAGRARMTTASLFAWPLAHSWFVAMGMLNYAFAVALALALLVVMLEQSRRPTVRRGAAIAALAAMLWWFHAFVLAQVGLLALIHVAARRKGERSRQAVAVLAPLAPCGLLLCATAFDRAAVRADTIVTRSPIGWHSPIDLVYNFWSECAGGYTRWQAPSLVVAAALAWFAWRGRREAVPFFGPAALAALAAAYALLPYNFYDWAYFNSRFLPLLYAAALLRVPERIPRPLAAFAGACAVAWSASLGVDYVRLDRDRALFCAGIGAVPEGAKLLPVVFGSRVTSENTWSLRHAWGYYVIAKSTSAPLLFADQKSFPVVWRDPPPPVAARALEAANRGDSTPGAAASEDWGSFWRDAARSFDHVLVWRAPAEILATIPPGVLRTTFSSDGLVILARAAGSS